MQDKSIAEIWDEVAKGYTTSIDGAERELADSIVEMLKKHRLKPGSRLLELGCGSGHLSACLNMAGYRTDMLDISCESLKKAQQTFDEHGLEGQFIQADMMSLEASDLSGYDLAWNSGVMEHFDDDTIIEVFKKIRKTARHTLIIVPNPQSVSYLLMRYVRQAENDWPYGKEYLRTDYAEAMNAAGLVDVSTHYIGKFWTSHNFRVAMKDAEGSGAFADMIDRDLLPEHEMYLIGYFASARDERAQKSQKVVTGAETSDNAGTITDIFDLYAERFGMEKRLREVSSSLEESWESEKAYAERVAAAEAERAELSKRLDEVSAALEESWKREKVYTEQMAHTEKKRAELEKQSEVLMSDNDRVNSELRAAYLALENESRSKERVTRSLDLLREAALKTLDMTNKLAQTRLFMFMHLVSRIGKQLIKGSLTEKKKFFSWLSAHISRRSYVDRGYNPLQGITDILSETWHLGQAEISAKTGDADMRVLFVYKWATMGGCERVFLSRARAFKEHGISIAVDVYFFHDSGGLDNFRRYIKHFELEDYLRVVPHIDEDAYDLIFTFDTQEIFDIVKNPAKVIVECHTPYKPMRKYLNDLPENIAGIAAPGETFLKSAVRAETATHFHDKLFTLPNFYIGSGEAAKPGWAWDKRPICYIGRMDSLKNSKELLKIFAAISSKSDEYTLVLAGNVTPDYMDIDEVTKQLGIKENTHYLGAVPFESVDGLLESVKNNRGIFISTSLGESFGLSVLEAMANGVPVLLSDIDCHKALVDDDTDLLYAQGSIDEAVSKFTLIAGDYGTFSDTVRKYAARYSSENFIEHWNSLI